MLNEYLMSTYNPLPVHFTHGQGAYLMDTENKRYLDAMCGIAVTSLGHNHPVVTKAIQTQAEKLLHTSNVFEIDNQALLGERLCNATGFEKVFFANSGAEANEAAIKLARLYGHQRGISEPKTIVMENAFHGRTMATISASGGRKYQAGFEPLVPGFVRAPYNDIGALEKIAAHDKDIVAVLVEPIQGEGGVYIPSKDYLTALFGLCQSQEWLLMLDEVQTGMGRTGSLFHFQQHNIIPDVLTSAKALANGIPIGACLARNAAATLFQPGSHGSTFGGNPFSCAAGLATLSVMQDTDIIQQSAKIGTYLVEGLKEGLKGAASVKDIRHAGMMIGIELDKPARPLLKAALAEGLLITVAREYTVRLLPPLILTEAQADKIV